MNKKTEKDIDKILQDEAERIFEIIINSYNKNEKISFNEIVRKNIRKGLINNEATIIRRIIKLIPNDLYIASDGKHIFVKQDEFFEKN